jgi:hypothetical protein
MRNGRADRVPKPSQANCGPVPTTLTCDDYLPTFPASPAEVHCDRGPRSQSLSPVAHFHAYHAGRRASVAVDGTVLAGSLEPRALQFVREWAGLHRQEILANWDRARKSEPLIDIPPLP